MKCLTIILYLKNQNAILPIFFYGLQFYEDDLEKFENYFSVQELRKNGFFHAKIALVLGLPKRRVEHYSYRYQEMQNLFHAKRFEGKWPEWISKKVIACLEQGISGTQIVKKILAEDGIALRTKGIRKRKLLIENPQP